MKKTIHPEFHEKATVTCACGHSFTVGSTVAAISTEICSECHPFFTGKQKLLDTARRVEKFQARMSKKSGVAADRKGKKVKRARAEQRKKTAGKVRPEKIQLKPKTPPKDN